VTTLDAERVDSFVSFLHRYMKTGTPMEAAVAEAHSLFGTDAESLAHLEEAQKIYRRRIRDIEYLREPRTLQERGRRTSWYPGPMPTDLYWPALEDYLLRTKGWGRETVRSIDQSSSRVISSLEFPGAQEFSTRGLVVGYVQSGKRGGDLHAEIKAGGEAGAALVNLAIHDG
jgi:hypothetical protein